MQPEQQVLGLLLLIAFVFAIFHRRPWRGSGTAYGTSRWCTEYHLRIAKMFSKTGLIIGRTARRRKLIRIYKYVHLSVFAPTGAGKGVSFVIPTLLDYRKGSVFVFDPKGELYKITSKARRKMGQRILRIDPFNVCGPGGDTFNVLDLIVEGDMLIDDARAAAEALIVHAPEGDRDPHWNASAAILFTAMIVATALIMKGSDRNLNSMREMISDTAVFQEIIKRLQSLGGMPARLGNMLEKQSTSEKEMSGVFSTAHTHSVFLDSHPIANTVASSSFSADVLLQPGTTLFFILPVEMLDSHRNFLRLVTSSLLRHIMRHGVKNNGEVLFILDECASLAGLDALAQALALGRGKGVRLYMFWQSVEQAQAAFRNTPNLVSDNSDAQIFFGVNSFTTAEHVSKLLGTWTMAISSANESTSHTRPAWGSTTHGDNRSVSRSETRSWSEISRPLLFPAEILQTSGEFLFAFIRGIPPLYARRIVFFNDKLFRGKTPLWWWLFLMAAIGLIVRGLMSS